MGDLIVQDQYLIRQDTDKVTDQFLMMLACRRAGNKESLDIQGNNFTILICYHTDIQNCSRTCCIWLTKEITGMALLEKVEETYGDCDVQLEYGGQPIYYFLLSVE